MAGSNKSGQDMEAGRTNRAEDQTRIWAQCENGEQFNGDVLFVVEAARDIEDDDFVDVSPGLHAIRGSSVGGTGVIGLSSQVADIDIALAKQVGVFGKGNIGVRGEGNPGVEGIGFSGGAGDGIGGGTGVVGRGGRRPEGELQGIGVVGLGGSHPGDAPVTPDLVVAGAGVFGHGAEGEGGTSPGAGVIGIGGDPLPGGSVAAGLVGLSHDINAVSASFALDTGVFGLGGTGVTGKGTVGPGVRGSGGPVPRIEVDPEELQAGVVGEAGVGLDQIGRTIHGAGVIGLARDKAPLTFAETGETGVYGTGQTGVKGVGAAGRGGVFESDQIAQVNLTPLFNQPNLPCEGKAGDLLVVSPLKPGDEDKSEQGVASLWFCIRSQTQERGPAVWARVAFSGIATCSDGPVPLPPQNLLPLKE
jgi:hypothetical protein